MITKQEAERVKQSHEFVFTLDGDAVTIDTLIGHGAQVHGEKVNAWLPLAFLDIIREASI